MCGYGKIIQVFLARVLKLNTLETRPKRKPPNLSPHTHTQHNTMVRPKGTNTGNAFPIRLYPEVEQQLTETARKVRLSKADTLRKAVEFGLPILENLLTNPRNTTPAVEEKAA